MPTSVMPVVFYRDPFAALDWLERAFGLEMGLVVTDQQGRIGHAELRWRGDAIGVGGEWAAPELLGPASLKSPASLDGVGTQFLRLFLDDGIDATVSGPRRPGPGSSRSPRPSSTAIAPIARSTWKAMSGTSPRRSPSSRSLRWKRPAA